ENHLATIGMQVNGIHEDVLLKTAAGEVKALPVSAVRRRIPLDSPIVSRHRGIAKAEPSRASQFDIGGAVNSKQVLQPFQRVGQPKNLMIQRRDAGIGDEPVLA